MERLLECRLRLLPISVVLEVLLDERQLRHILVLAYIGSTLLHSIQRIVLHVLHACIVLVLHLEHGGGDVLLVDLLLVDLLLELILL